MFRLDSGARLATAFREESWKRFLTGSSSTPFYTEAAMSANGVRQARICLFVR